MTAAGRRYTPFKIVHKYIRAHTTFYRCLPLSYIELKVQNFLHYIYMKKQYVKIIRLNAGLRVQMSINKSGI